MNYGYHVMSLEGHLKVEPLDSKIEERFPLQMYRQVFTHAAASLSPRKRKNMVDLLEVGCGRGGGIVHLASEAQQLAGIAVRATGGDLSDQQISLCTQRFASVPQEKRPAFVQADAEALPFGDSSFDVVINVESSHCYPRFGQFLAEVSRVLRKDGVFGIVDFRSIPDGRMDTMQQLIRDVPGLRVVEDVDITPNVAKACEQDNDRRA